MNVNDKTNAAAVLGASDPEMALIRKLLEAAGVRCFQATDEAGRPVTPGGAYQAQGVTGAVAEWAAEGGPTILLRVECGGPAIAALAEGAGGNCPVVVIDHHRPGDPGHGRPAAEAWEASSLGQIHAWLAGAGLISGEPSQELRAAGAQDHDAAAALGGRVPGVDPAEVRRQRTANACGFLKLSQEEYEKEVFEASKGLASAPLLRINWGTCRVCFGGFFAPECDACGGTGSEGGRDFRDLRGWASHRLTAEAALRAGEAYIADVDEVARGEGGAPLPDARGVRKAVIGGHVSPAACTAAVEMLVSEGLVRPYDTGRGMGGAYYP